MDEGSRRIGFHRDASPRLSAQGKGDLGGESGHPGEDLLERTAARERPLERACPAFDDAELDRETVERACVLPDHEDVRGQEGSVGIRHLDEPGKLQSPFLGQTVESFALDHGYPGLGRERFGQRRGKGLGKEGEGRLRSRAREVDDSDALRRDGAGEGERQNGGFAETQDSFLGHVEPKDRTRRCHEAPRV